MIFLTSVNLLITCSLSQSDRQSDCICPFSPKKHDLICLFLTNNQKKSTSHASGAFWRQIEPFQSDDNLCNCCVTLQSHFHSYTHHQCFQSDLSPLVASRERCWVIKKRGKRELCPPTSLASLFMYRHIFMARCITTQRTAAGGRHKRDKTYIQWCFMVLKQHQPPPVWISLGTQGHHLTSSLPYIITPARCVSTALGGLEQGSVCLLTASKVLWVKHAQRCCWSITGRREL